MKKHVLRMLCTALSLLMLFSVLVSCAGTDKPESTSEVLAGTTADLGTGTEPETEYELDNLGDMNLNTTLNVLAWKDVEHEEFESEGTTGDLINDAIYSRNETVQRRLGITINWLREDGDSDNRSAWNKKVQSAVQSGDHPYDVVAGYSLSVTFNASTGLLTNMLDDTNCPYLDFDKQWWSKLLVSQGTIKNQLFFASGDISRNALEMMYVCFVNTDLLTDHNLENPQKLVPTGDWTYDKFIEMCQGVYEGSGVKDELTDTFGYMCQGIHWDPWFYGSGATICEKNDEGEIIESPSFFDEKVINTIDKLHKLLSSEDAIAGSSAGKHQNAFKEGRLLFCTDRCRCSHKVFADNSDLHFVVVPCPKYDKDQERYYTCMGNPFTLYGITVDCEKKPAASAFIECMASEGYRQLTPAVFELSLKTKYISDPVSAQMYDLIRENVTYDIGRLFSGDLAGQGTFRTAVANLTTSWASLHTSITAQLKNKLKILNRAFN